MAKSAVEMENKAIALTFVCRSKTQEGGASGAQKYWLNLTDGQRRWWMAKAETVLALEMALNKKGKKP